MSNEVVSVSIEAGEAVPANTQNKAPERPAHIPEKFWDAEKGVVKVDDLAKSYAEAEKKISQKAPEQEPKKEEVKEEAKKLDPGANLGIEQEQAKKTVEEAGLDMAALQKEYDTAGKLSEETYKKLEGSKIPRAIVDGYIEGQKALAVKAQSEVFTAVGGKETYAQAVAWAKANLPADEIAAYDRSLQGKPLSEITMQVKGLVARYKAEGSQDPNLVLGGEAPSGIKPYKNMNELVEDQRKPEYKTNPEFRAKVRARIAASQDL